MGRAPTCPAPGWPCPTWALCCSSPCPIYLYAVYIYLLWQESMGPAARQYLHPHARPRSTKLPWQSRPGTGPAPAFLLCPVCSNSTFLPLPLQGQRRIFSGWDQASSPCPHPPWRKKAVGGQEDLGEQWGPKGPATGGQPPPRDTRLLRWRVPGQGGELSSPPQLQYRPRSSPRQREAGGPNHCPPKPCPGNGEGGEVPASSRAGAEPFFYHPLPSSKCR